MTLWKVLTGRGSWQELCPHGGPTPEQPAPEGQHLLEGTHTGAAHGLLQPVGRTHVRGVHGGWPPVEAAP